MYLPAPQAGDVAARLLLVRDGREPVPLSSTGRRPEPPLHKPGPRARQIKPEGVQRSRGRRQRLRCASVLDYRRLTRRGRLCGYGRADIVINDRDRALATATHVPEGMVLEQASPESGYKSSGARLEISGGPSNRSVADEDSAGPRVIVALVTQRLVAAT